MGDGFSSNYREEIGWPRVSGGDDISPPNASAQALADAPSEPKPAADDAGKVASLDEHRHAGD